MPAMRWVWVMVSVGVFLPTQAYTNTFSRTNFNECRSYFQAPLSYRISNAVYRTADFLGSTVDDIFMLHRNIISRETFIVVAASLPFFLMTRMWDCDIQGHFFSHHSHKNINQFPHWCHDACRFGIAIPIVALGSQLFLSSDPEWQQTAWMLLLGLPFVIFGKDIIKRLDADFCLRPWHENFCHTHKQSPGGFPSGHMAQATYIATLYGIRFGPALAVPLSALAIALGITFINCNRHYTSQIIAGAGLGMIYAFAANKVIDSKLSHDITLGLCFDRGQVGLKASYQF